MGIGKNITYSLYYPNIIKKKTNIKYCESLSVWEFKKL